MKRRVGLIGTCVIGAVLSGAWGSNGALGQTATTTNSAPSSTDAFAAAEPIPYISDWWFHGMIEAGGRFFLNDPQRNGSASQNQTSLAKYYEYSTIEPGPFSNIWLSSGSKDGLYQIDLGGKNIGYDDQAYHLDVSKAGQHYFNFGWDQTPHLYSTSALTPYLGVGSNALTLPAGLPSKLNANSSVINPFLQQTDIGIKRDTASVQYRWTPTDDWDVKADYSHLNRYGTQVDGVVGLGSGSAFSTGPNQVPKPVSDTTQNFGLNGEYVGTSPWNQKFNFKLAYDGSQYHDDYSSYTVQGLFCNSPYAVAADCATATLSPVARLSLPPSNQMNSFSGTLGADLPWKSRYVGKVSYTMMRQNDAFIPMTSNPNALPAALVLPASSLNGAINTTLSDNVITTQITPELKSKLSYRYYNFDNNTPELFFPSWVSYDHLTAGGLGTEAAIRSLAPAYTKQNAGEDLNWRPSREWNLGAAFGYERHSYTRDAVDVTNEYSGKVFVDWKPYSWFGIRSSSYYSDRRYENYDYNAFVASVQFPGRGPVDGWFVNPAYRQMMTSNRERWKANVAVDLVAIHNLTITPTFKYQDDYYGLDPTNQLGLTDSRSWSGGVDVTYVVDPGTSIMVGYMREYSTQLLYNINATTNNSVPGPLNEQTNDRTVVDTFTAMAKYAAIPDKLDLMLRYTLSYGVDHQNLNLVSGALPTGGQFPDVTNWFQRLDATAVYTFDKAAVAEMGWKGEVKAKLHYVWERNSVSNWSNDPLSPFSPFVNATSIWMGYDNPNYDVHMLIASLAFKW